MLSTIVFLSRKFCRHVLSIPSERDRMGRLAWIGSNPLYHLSMVQRYSLHFRFSENRRLWIHCYRIPPHPLRLLWYQQVDWPVTTLEMLSGIRNQSAISSMRMMCLRRVRRHCRDHICEFVGGVTELGHLCVNKLVVGLDIHTN